MLLVYATRTLNIQRFVDNLCWPKTQRIEQNLDIVINKPFMLITYTDKFGEVPEIVEKFLFTNHHWLQAVAASGNRNFGSNFANAANLISKKYNVPIIAKFELSGTDRDLKIVKNYLIQNLK